MMLLAYLLLGTAALLWGLIAREVVFIIRRSTSRHKPSFYGDKRSFL